jgi:acetyl-CoA/propionyl-CoA carboxylase biotin carboxyl carrier protein
VRTNVAFLRALLRDPDVRAGRLDTGLVERLVAAGGAGTPAAVTGGPGSAAVAPGSPGPKPAADQERGVGEPLPRPSAGPAPDEVLAGAALARLLTREPAGPATDPWDIPDGWRPGEHAWTTFRLSPAPGAATEVRVRGLPSAGAEVTVGDGDPVAARAEFQPATVPAGDDPAGTDLLLTYAGRTVRYAYAADGPVAWLGRDGQAWAIAEAPPAPLRGTRTAAADGTVRSPMPGTVLAVPVTEGEQVTAGQPVLVVEAMKMEHTVTAPLDGMVTDLTARPGQQVRMDEPLAVIKPA